MPVLAGCLVNLECVTVGDYEGGDHRILVGHVEHIHLSPDGQPLVHCRGLYGTLAAD